MRKNILLLVCAVLLNLSAAFANSVSVQQAQTIATTFFKIKLGNNAPRTALTATLNYTRTETDNTVDFYVFDMSPVKGFVIVSATDNDVPIIGYSTTSPFPTDFSKIGLREWLNRWSEELHYVALHNITATPLASIQWDAYRQGVAPASEKAGGVTPFCQTTWDQNTEYGTGPNLYNNYCPGGTGTNQAVTGCVATTMAQIMRYWNYPTKGTSSSSYNDATSQGYSQDYGTLSFNYGNTTFDWANMPLTLTNTSTTTQIDAVGTLMYACGVSVDMDYSPTGSGAFVLTSESGGGACAQKSYVTYFGYQSIIQGIILTGTGSTGTGVISSAAFTDSIEVDLARGRLVQVEGQDPTNGGHTWVCDGYETSPSTMFHMNWGWSGYADGYFALTNLDPNDGTQLTFSQDIGALIHILPPAQTGILHEVAAATLTGVCPGSPTQLSATTHTNTTYGWTPTTALSNPNISNPVATPTSTTIYTVTADSAGVTATSTITITVHPAPTAAINTSANPTCYGSANGSATVTVTGGTSGYTYHWSGGQTVAALTNLGPGTYSVTVTDANSCTGSVTKTLTQPAVLSASTTNVVNATCGPTGSISTSVSGGTSNYRYLWSNGETTATASSLTGATYTVTITDAHSCTTTTAATITSTSTLNLSATATNVMCYGNTGGSATATVTGSTGSVTYHWSNGATTSSIQNVVAATYTVTVSDGSGCSVTAAKTVAGPTSALSASPSTTNAGCGNAATGSASVTVTGGTGGYSYHWDNGNSTSSLSGLASGTYHVTVTDANSCTTVASAVVASASPISVVATTNNTTCFGGNNGSVEINTSNGTAPYSFTWSTGGTASSIANLPAGSYSVTVSDFNHCTTTTNITIAQPNQIQITTTETNATGVLDNGSATVSNIVGATAPYTYIWSDGATTQTINNIAPGNYSVTITDANGCYQSATDFVNVSTGINTVNSVITFSVYPNPAGSYAMLQLDEFNNATIMNLKNILGQTVISQTISAKQTQLNLGSLANGVYLVELRQGEKTAVKQLVIAR